MIGEIPSWKSSDLFRESAFGSRLPPYPPHVDAALLPEMIVGGQEVSAANYTPDWNHPEKWNTGLHTMPYVAAQARRAWTVQHETTAQLRRCPKPPC